MDELIDLIKSLHTKVDIMSKEIEHLKKNQQTTTIVPMNMNMNMNMNTNDYSNILKTTTGIEFETWLNSIKITAKDIETLLLRSIKDAGKHDKNYLAILEKLDTTKSMQVFENNKNTIYIYVNGKWTSMKKDNIVALQTKIQNKVRDVFRKMVKEKNALLNHESIQEMSYMEQRNKISQISEATHTQFKTLLYKIIATSTSV